MKKTIAFIILSLLLVAPISRAAPERIRGENRYETAAALQKKYYPDADTVILASGEDYPDALTAAGPARLLKAPILLTEKDTLPPATKDALEELRPETVLLIGGRERISDELAESLPAPFKRISGKDRFETSRLVLSFTKFDGEPVKANPSSFGRIIASESLAIATDSFVLYDGGAPEIDPYELSKKVLAEHPAEEIFLVSGENFADGLTALAAGKQVLLTKPSGLIPGISENLPPADNITVVGGYESIFRSVEDQLYGADRAWLEDSKLPEPMPQNREGEVMVLMYHDISPFNDTYHRTPEAFRYDLANLYRKGYLPVSLTDYAVNNITIPEGYTPYVLTFDDGTLSKVAFDEEGNLKEDSALGLLLQMEDILDGFRAKADFFVSGKIPFRQEEFAADKLKLLKDHDMIIGNHSMNHVNLKQHPEKIEEEIALQKKNIESWLPDYKVETFSIPYSVVFDDPALYDRIRKGTFEGISYENKVVVQGGAAAAPSPLYVNRDTVIPRITAAREHVGGKGLYDFLQYYEEHPEKRYVQ